MMMRSVIKDLVAFIDYDDDDDDDEDADYNDEYDDEDGDDDDGTCDKGLSQLHPPNRCLARTQLLRLDPPTFSMTTMMIKTITMIRMITMIMMITMRLPLEQRFKVVQEGEISVGRIGH